MQLNINVAILFYFKYSPSQQRREPMRPMQTVKEIFALSTLFGFGYMALLVS